MTNFRKIPPPVIAACLGLLLSACTGSRESYPTLDVTELRISISTMPTELSDPQSAPSETAFPTPPATLSPPTPSATSSPTPFVPFRVSIWADNVNLRADPGYLFPVIRILRQGTPLRLKGRSPGGEWFYAEGPDEIHGWVFGMLLDQDPRLAEIPLREPQNVQLVRGYVADADGIPIQGVSFSVSKGTGPSAPTNVVHTDASGEFFSFLPPGSDGAWTVTHTGIACASNVWQGDGCATYKTGYQGLVDPHTVVVVLPYADQLVFFWK
jgi:hypothetical protein